MNSAEVFDGNKKGVIAISKSLQTYLQKAGEPENLEVTIKDPEIVTHSHSVTNLGLLRFNSTKSVGTYTLGISDPASLTLWPNLLPKKVVEEGAPPAKSHEFELMKHFYMGLAPELKAAGFTVDPKSAIIQEGEELGGWRNLTVDQSYKMTFTTKAGEISFEIPLFNVAFAKKTTLDLFGFREEARILVVDDSPVSRKYSRNCLATAGYFNVDESPDGQAALNKIKGSHPPFELVIADWHMPIMSGFELLQKIRGIDEFKKLPVIMVTGEKNKEEVVNAIKAGASGYLVKPVAVPNFLAALKKAGNRA